ncbi:MAG: Hsp20/alpha crystallin family protein [Anaerolineae bacterium]|jgi:HSP20 family protein
MMTETGKGAAREVDHIHAEMLGMLRESMPGRRWVSKSQRKTWRPPTDVYETDDYLVVKVEIAGMEGKDFAISLDGKRLVVSGVRHDPAAKLGYQQMEIPYGGFETDVYLTRAVDEDRIEATYQNGFLSVVLPKAKPHQVPVVNVENSAQVGKSE